MPASDLPPASTTSSRSWRVPLVGAALLVAIACAAYWQLFSSFAPYDDEGYILLSLRMYQAGHPLYNETATQYGPAFFILQDGLHRVLHLPMTHDVARAKTWFVWVMAAAPLSAGLIWRWTGRPVLTLIAGLGVVWHLDRLGLEPGHPQDVAILALPAMLWLAKRSTSAVTRGRWSVGLLGVATGVLAMTKLNLGVLCGLACVAALLLDLPFGRAAPWSWRFVVAIGVALPFVLARGHVLSWTGMLLPLAVIAGWLGLCWEADDRGARFRPAGNVADAPWGGWWSVAIYIASSVATAIVFAAIALANGTTPGGLWYGLVGQHQGFLDLFYHDPPFPIWSAAWSVGGVALAVWSRRNPRVVDAVQWLAPGLLLCTGLQVFWESFRPLTHGLDDRAAAGLLAACVPPLAWVSLRRRPMPANRHAANLFARRLLCLLAIVLPISAYPTPGTQLAVATVPALLLVVLVAGDWLSRWEADTGAAASSMKLYVRCVAALAVMTLLCRDATAWRQWSQTEPLALPGAEYLRLPLEDAASRRQVVHYLREHADVFVASPTGCCSLYLWSGIAPPTTRNVTFWEVQLSDREQRDVIAALESAEHPLLVVDHHQAQVIYRNAPLFRYLERRFTVRQVAGALEVWSPGPVLAEARD